MSVWAAIALGAALVWGLAAWSRRRQTEQLRLFSQRLLAGDFTALLPDGQGGLLEGVKPAMEALAKGLGERFLSAEETRRQLMAALNGMREGVVLCDPEGAVLLMNPAFRRLAGFEEPIARRYYLWEALRDPELNEAVKQALSQARSRTVDLPLDGGRVEGRALVTPIDGLPGGSGGGAVVLLLDRTEERKVERLRSDFVANVSHELRTPLSAIKAALETLSDGALDDPAVNRAFVDKALRHSERLEELLTDLLNLAQLEEQRRKGLRAVEASCRANEAWEDALALLEPSLRRYKGTVRAEGLEPLPALALDRSALRQVLVNYVENALKYSGPEPLVSLGGRRSGAEVELWVQDTGAGIPEEDQARVFERFYRVDKARTRPGQAEAFSSGRSSGGSGLGLSIVKHLIENAGGSVGLESKPGQGSRFWVKVPVRDGKA